MSFDLGAPAGSARALRWHGAATLMRFEGRLRAALQTWSAGWGVAASDVRCELAWLAQEPAALQWHALADSAAGETLAWIGSATGAVTEPLAALLFGKLPPSAGNADAPTLADVVAVDAWQALRATLTAGLQGSLLPAADQASRPPSADRRAWSGAVRATISLGAEHWVLHARAAAVDGLLESRSAAAGARPPLAALPKALERHRVGLQARLVDVPVTLGDLMALQAGDVLLTPHRLAEPLRVICHGPSAPDLYAAHLAQRDGRMALVLCASPAAPNDRFEGNHMNTTPPTAHLLGLPEATDPAAGTPALIAAANPLLSVKTTLQVCVGEAVLSVGELTQTRVGQVIKLDREVDGLVDLMLDGRVVARGQLVAVDDCFGVRVTELPLPLSGATGG